MQFQGSGYSAVKQHEALYDHSTITGSSKNAEMAIAANIGDGRHGPVTLVAGGSTSIPGVIAWDGTRSVYYCQDDFFPYSLTFEDTVVLEPRGYRISVFTTTDASACVTSGGISANGRDAVGTAAGAGHPPVSASAAIFAGGGNGAAGGNVAAAAAVNGTASVNITPTARLGGRAGLVSGGAIGSGTTSTGATSTVGSAWVKNTHGARAAILTEHFLAFGASNQRALGGVGGSSGAGRANTGASATRGGGGGGAGCVAFSSRTITCGSAFKITANGGLPGVGTVTNDASVGGGCGGGAGYMRIVIGEITSGTLVLEAKGGAGGDGKAVIGVATYRDGQGGDGADGGVIEYFILSGTVSTDVSAGAGGIGVTVGVGGTATDGDAGTAGTVIAAPDIS